MPRHVVSSLVLAVVLLANMPGSVAACTCGGTSEDSALANADVASIGVVTQVEDPNSLFGNSRQGELWVWLCDGNERLATGVPTLPAAGSPGSFLLLAAAAALLLVITLVMGGTRERPVGPVA